MDIKPISVLKNKTADLVREITSSGRAVNITQHGKAKVVVLDLEEYQRWKDVEVILRRLLRG